VKSVVDVIIPAFNEASAIGKVIAALPNSVREIVVADNGSTDGTSGVAQQHGATVVTETQKGYGHACLKAMAYIEKKATPPDIVVFLDGDFSDYPEELPKLVAPIASKEAVFVVGARSAALRTKNALTPQQQFGNALATLLMRWLYNSRFTDLGPFRAIDWKTLLALNMKDKTYGWTVEMQLKILQRKLPYAEIPVRYKARIGTSKVSGTVKGTILAGIKILYWIAKSVVVK
jgi:glycosyltransferase involved in cell wall biosynthesis